MKQQRIIILEGVDKTGKTTIGNKLSTLLKIPYFRGDRPRNLSISYAEQTAIEQEMLLSLFEQTKMSLIMDRGYPSEYVYAKAFGRGTDMKMIRDVNNRFSNLNILIVYLSASDEVLMKRFKKEKRVERDKIVLIKKYYRDFFENINKCRMLEFDTSKMTPEQTIKKILQHLRVTKNAN